MYFGMKLAEDSNSEYYGVSNCKSLNEKYGINFSRVAYDENVDYFIIE